MLMKPSNEILVGGGLWVQPLLAAFHGVRSNMLTDVDGPVALATSVAVAVAPVGNAASDSSPICCTVGSIWPHLFFLHPCNQPGLLSCAYAHLLTAASATICYGFVYTALGVAWRQPSSGASAQTHSSPVKSCLTEDVFLRQTFCSCYLDDFLCNFKISIVACPGQEENTLIF